MNKNGPIFIAPSKIAGAGRGIFAKEFIQKGTLIETAPVVLVPKKDISLIEKTELDHYFFAWKTQGAIVLGTGSLYNHSYTPNAFYKRSFHTNTMHYIAYKDILPNEEITINYNGSPLDKTPIWVESLIPVLEKTLV